MNLFIYSKSPDLTAAVATTETDANALIAAYADPTKAANAAVLARISTTLADLVLGDNEPITLKFLSAASTYESWSGAADYTPTIALGCPTSDGADNLASTATFSVVADGWSGTLDLTTAKLVDAVHDALVCAPRRGGMQAVLQVIITDADGDRETYATIPIFVRARVNALGTTAPDPAPSYYTAAETDTLFLHRGLGYEAVSNANGNTTITPASTVAQHLAVVNFSGSARTSVVVIETTGRVAGDRVYVRLNLPATESIVAEVRNASDVGTLLSSITTDGSGDDALIEYYYDGAAFAVLRTNYPA